MKYSVIAIACGLLLAGGLAHANITVTGAVQEHYEQPSHSESEVAHKLNLLLQQELKHIDALIDILQYLGQSIGKGSIIVENKATVTRWLSEQQKVVRSIEANLEKLGKSVHTPLDEQRLSFHARNIQMLIEHLDHAITNKLEILNPFTFHQTPFKSGKVVTVEQTESTISTNTSRITELRRLANNFGLTFLNLLARELDALNSDFKIVERGKMITSALGFVAMGLYLMPEDWIIQRAGLPAPAPAAQQQNQNNDSSSADAVSSLPAAPVADRYLIPEWLGSPLLKAKSWLGKRPVRHKDTGETTNNHELGIIGKIDSFYNHKETKAILAGATFTGMWMYGQQINRATRDLSRQFRRWWAAAKGFTVQPDKNHYRVYDDLTLDDERLVGLESQKDILRDIARYVLDPEVFDRTQANPAKSILLTGPSGSGKTLLARALSGTINQAMQERGKKNKFGFKEVKWSEIVNYGDDGLKMVIEEAKDNAPCVLFIDELHNLPLQTAAHGGNKVLSEFLTAMSGLNSEGDANHQVILLAATNKQELLDPALLRAGRFGDIVIRCEKPNLEQRKTYFNVMFRQNAIDSTEIDIDSLAEQTEGATFSDLDGILREASFKARTLAQRVKEGHIQKKIDSHMHRINKNVTLTQQERQVIAAHLAGVTLLGVLPETKTSRSVKLVTTCGIWPSVVERRVWNNDTNRDPNEGKIKYGKIFTYNPHENSEFIKFEDLLKSAKIKLAGKIAEQVLLGTAGSTYKNESRRKALELIKKYYMAGLDEKDLPKSEKEKIAQDAYQALKNFETEVRLLLEQHKQSLERIASLLQTQTTVSDREIADILKA